MPSERETEADGPSDGATIEPTEPATTAETSDGDEGGATSAEAEATEPVGAEATVNEDALDTPDAPDAPHAANPEAGDDPTAEAGETSTTEATDTGQTAEATEATDTGATAEVGETPGTTDGPDATEGGARDGRPITEATELAAIEADLSELAGHVTSWLNKRFLDSDDAGGMNLEDIAGLILWLQQWHVHFDGYEESAASLAEAGQPALAERLAQIRQEIDNSIENFTTMAADLLNPSGQAGEASAEPANRPTSRRRLGGRRR